LNEGDEGEGIWWMDFVYLYEIEQRTKKPLASASSGVEKGSKGRDDMGNLTNAQCKPICNCHDKFPCTMNIFQ
jgi:hypothetical protein